MQQAFTINEFAPLINSAEFQKSYLFKIILPSFYCGQYDNIVLVKDKLQFCTSSTSFPSSNTGIQTIPFYNSEIKIGTKTVYDPWNVTFKYNIYNENFIVAEKEKGPINCYEYFDFWRNSVFWEKDKISSVPFIYKGIISLILLDNLGNEQYEFKLEGAWPSSVSGGTLDYSNDAITTFNVAFCFDRFVFKTYVSDIPETPTNRATTTNEMLPDLPGIPGE